MSSALGPTEMWLGTTVSDRYSIFLLWLLTHKCGVSIPGCILYKSRTASV